MHRSQNARCLISWVMKHRATLHSNYFHFTDICLRLQCSNWGGIWCQLNTVETHLHTSPSLFLTLSLPLSLFHSLLVNSQLSDKLKVINVGLPHAVKTVLILKSPEWSWTDGHLTSNRLFRFASFFFYYLFPQRTYLSKTFLISVTDGFFCFFFFQKKLCMKLKPVVTVAIWVLCRQAHHRPVSCMFMQISPIKLFLILIKAPSYWSEGQGVQILAAPKCHCWAKALNKLGNVQKFVHMIKQRLLLNK